jgi:hypothetical protein
LADHRSRPDRVWNRIPDDVRGQIIDLALQVPELSPRELAVRFTDERKYFVSEASVYRLLKAHDLITSPAYVVIKARRTSSRTRPPPSTSSGRPTSPTSRSPDGAGTISRRCWTTSHVTSWPGGSGQPCAPRTSRQRWTRHWQHQASIAPLSYIDRVCSATMARRMLQVIWPTGSKTRVEQLARKLCGSQVIWHHLKNRARRSTRAALRHPSRKYRLCIS